MASLSPTATTLSPPTDRTSPPLTGSECNNASVNLQPVGFPPADPWFSPNPMSTWPYPSSQIDPRLWVWPTGIHPLFGPGPTFPNYTEISPSHPWMPNLGYPAIPHLPLTFNNPVAVPETAVGDDAYAEEQPESPRSDRRADSHNPSRLTRFKCKWEGCTYPRTFTKGTSLWRHIQGHIGPGLLECPAPGCKRTFDLGRMDKYNAHVRLVHRDMPDLIDLPRNLTGV